MALFGWSCSLSTKNQKSGAVSDLNANILLGKRGGACDQS